MRNELFKQTTTGDLHLLNTTIIPAGADGLYRATTITLDEARHLFAAGVNAGDEGWGHYPQSHVGHESTAALMTTALGSAVKVTGRRGTAKARRWCSRWPGGLRRARS